MANSTEYLQRAFEHFAEVCTGYSPLYVALSNRVAKDDEVKALVGETAERQLPANLLFGAAQYLLLSGVEHRLGEYYYAVGGRRAVDDEAYTALADFCREHAEVIRRLASTRRVQTNEVGRCGVLLPMLTRALRRLGERPVHLIELGASAGLNLLLDRYGYEYTCDAAGVRSDDGPPGAGQQVVHRLGGDSPARIRTELRGSWDRDSLPDALPAVADRSGLDIAPVDVGDDAAVHWIAAMIWADQARRIDLFRAAAAFSFAAEVRRRRDRENAKTQKRGNARTRDRGGAETWERGNGEPGRAGSLSVGWAVPTANARAQERAADG